MRRKKLFLTLASLLLIGQGCLRLAPDDGGLYRSVTKGEIWEQKSQLLTVGGQVRNFNNLDVLTLAIDPQEHRTIYAGTDGEGLLYSYDNGESWQQFAQLGGGTVRNVAVDALNKCVFYASVGNRVLKTFDCGRNWQQVFLDTRTGATVTALIADPTASGLLLAGTRLGDILITNDSGYTWTVVTRLTSPIVDILISPRDQHTVYVATQDRGIFKTTNSGKDWLDLSERFKQFSGANAVQDLVFIDKTGNGLMFSSPYGLIKSRDGGQSWQSLILLTPPGAASIRALAVNQDNPQEIYYASNTTFYRSFDGGVKWSNRQLPTSRQPTILLLDKTNPNIIFLGVLEPKEKKQFEFIKYEPEN